MKNRQIMLLFVTMVLNFTTALGLLPFLPLHAISNLGVDPGQTGVFLAVVSGALTAGTISGGWLSDKFHRRKRIVLASALIGFPSLFLIGFVTDILQLTILTAIAWLAIGMSTTMVRILTGIFADENQRGRIFGVIGAATPLSALIGGFIAGPIVDRWNIPTLFILMSFTFIFQLITALFMVDVEEEDEDDNSQTVTIQANGFGLSYWLLAIANLILFTGVSCIIAGRPLHMDQLGYDGTAISQILIPGAFISLPLTFYIGDLSDRVGRKRMLILCYLTAVFGMMILIGSEPIWHFWLSEVFLAFVGISVAVSAALVTDLVPRKMLDKALSRITAMSWIGSILGFALSGYIIDLVGISMMFGVATGIGIVSMLLILPIQQDPSTAVVHP